MFTFRGRAINWKNVKQSCLVESTIEAKYVAACEAVKEVVWLIKFLVDLGAVRIEWYPITLFYDNSGAIVHNPWDQQTTRE